MSGLICAGNLKYCLVDGKKRSCIKCRVWVDYSEPTFTDQFFAFRDWSIGKPSELLFRENFDGKGDERVMVGIAQWRDSCE